MKRTSIGLLILASVLTFAWLVVVQAFTYNIVTNNMWTVTDASGNPRGFAQHVCLGSTSPNCPTGATSYGYGDPSAWSANLSSIPGARWIWAPNITGTTTGAANTEFTFESPFYLCDSPQGGTISVAADDAADVFLNYATTPIVSSKGFTALATAKVPPSSLTRGLNNIQVKVRNAPGCASDQYQCNPAGFVFGGSFTDGLSALPTCSSKGMTYSVGQSETGPCPTGTSGTAFRVCGCPPIGPVIGVWTPWQYGGCVAPPPTCTGSDGKTPFAVGTSEPLPCPPGQNGSAFRACGANGSWGPTDTSKCAAPPVTCTGSAGTPFGVGSTESLSCTAPEVGSRTRTCQADGTWGPTSSTCQLPLTCAGCQCGARDGTPPVTARCPTGTSCQSRRTRVCSGWWIFSSCDYIQSTDWFCLAP